MRILEKEEKGVVSVLSQRKRKVMSVKFKDKLKQGEESDVCPFL